MRALIQRVSSAGVAVGDRSVAHIGPGLLILLGVSTGDSNVQAGKLCGKIANLRIFDDEAGKMNLSLLDTKGEALVVSQFTLLADTERGRRPSFVGAADPVVAEPLVDHFAEQLRALGIATQTGAFGQHMQVEIHNDGPVTIWLEQN